LVPIRDPKTLLPFKGVQIGDMGPKIGLNGLDNGFMSFNNYRIPKQSLLNRNVMLKENGEYSLKSKKVKAQGITLGILSLGKKIKN
jgi:acyl-CoA oxidase